MRRLGLGVMVLALLAASCGDDSTTSPSTSDPDSSDSGETTSSGDSADSGDSGDVEGTTEAIELTVADGWTMQRMGPGIKPALALDGSGAPAVAFLTEERMGSIFFASETTGWEIETVHSGYFYGPIDLDFSPEDLPHIVYHDHQAQTFREELGDLTLISFDGTSWETDAASDDGHDGWDSTLRFAPSGELWAAGIDPSQFGSTDGVEFYEFDGTEWTITSVNGPPVPYEFNVSLAVGTGGEPALSYYDQANDALHVATRTDGEWMDEVVPAGDGGMFSSFFIADDGTRHLSFYAHGSGSGGEVRYAVDDGSGWIVETVHALDDVQLGMTGARRVTSLQLLGDGSPAVASADRVGVWISTASSDGWDTVQIIAAGADRPLGQQVQLVVDGPAMHLATFEVTSPNPLEGEILYLAG